MLNVLDVPSFNQDRGKVLADFGALVDAGASLLLPLAAIFETGDHIADLRDGRQRRRYAEVFRGRENASSLLEKSRMSRWGPIRSQGVSIMLRSGRGLYLYRLVLGSNPAQVLGHESLLTPDRR